MRTGLSFAVLLTLAAILASPATALAQSSIINLPPVHEQGDSSQGYSSKMPGAGLPFPPGFQPPAGFFDEFWKDPAFAAEIHLSDAQRKQLQEAALSQRLAMVDGGADAFKALIKLSATLDAEPFDDAAYQKQLDELAASSGKLVQTLGAMAASPRRVLNNEQWAKLQSRQRERAKQQAVAKAAASPSSVAPRIPPSLMQPVPR